MKRYLLLFILLLVFAAGKAQQKKINILSYNVHNCIGMDGKRDYQRIAQVILKASPDVVALLELDSATQRNNGVFALEKLKEYTKMQGIYASAIPFQGGSYGIGLLSKEVPLKHKVVPMPGREEERTMIVAEFKDYIFCATHQSLTPEDQLISIPIILKALEGISKPVFLAGDMNSLPADKPQQELGKHFVTLNDVNIQTYPANLPDSTLDYIYLDRKNENRFKVIKRKVINEPVASDHRPVQVIVSPR